MKFLRRLRTWSRSRTPGHAARKEAERLDAEREVARAEAAFTPRQTTKAGGAG